MKMLLASLAVVMVFAIASCSDSVTEPGGQAIVGTWKASKKGLTFGVGISVLTLEFKDNGTYTVDADGIPASGTYVTAGNSASSTIRDITMNDGSGAVFKGIYEINGNQMKLELILSPTPAGLTAPDAAAGIGSTAIGGAKTTVYVTECQKQ